MKSYHGRERYYLRSRTSLNLAIPVGYVGTFCFIVFFSPETRFYKSHSTFHQSSSQTRYFYRYERLNLKLNIFNEAN